jgi:streptogramin lyase
MVRQAVFGALLSLVICSFPGRIIAIQDTPPPAGSRPPAEIPLSRLKPDAAIPLRFEPGAVPADDAVWTIDRTAGAIVRLAAKDNSVGAPVPVGGQPCASLAIAFESVWAPLCGDGTIARVALKDQKVTTTVRAVVADPDGRIASSAGSIWAITDRKGVVSRIDPDTGASVAEIYVPKGTVAVASGPDALWITCEDAGRLVRVSPHDTQVVEEISVGRRPRRLTVGEGAIWTLNGDGTVSRVDPATNKVVATIKLERDTAKGDIAAGAGSVWVSLPGTPIVRIDPRTNRAVQAFTGEGGGAILVAHGSLWVSAGPKVTWRLDPKLVEAIRP